MCYYLYMKILMLASFLLVQNCDPTEKAKLRVHGEQFFKSCMSELNDQKHCLRQVAKWCREHNLENTCGTDDLWTQKRF